MSKDSTSTAKATAAKLLGALQEVPGAAISKRGAALLLSHMMTDLGSGKVLAMSSADAAAYATLFRRRFPGAWPAITMGDPMRLERALTMHRVPHDTRQEYEIAMGALLEEPRATPPLPLSLQAPPPASAGAAAKA